MHKPGIRTTELWLLVLSGLEALTNALSSNQHVNFAALGSAALYAVCRTALKVAGSTGGAGGAGA